MFKLFKIICGSLVLVVNINESLMAEAFPLKNGDFSKSEQVGLPADWRGFAQAGKYEFGAEPKSDQLIVPNRCVVITCQEAGKACFYQDVTLMPGSYLLTVEVLAPGKSKAMLVVDQQSSAPKSCGDWEKLSMTFSGGKKSRIHLFSTGEGVVKFRNASIEIQKLQSDAVPVSQGQALGSIVLPEKPTPAEAYAAYEFQRCVYLMTGKVVGLKGRDETRPGREVLVGRATGEAFLGKIKSTSDEAYRVAVEDSKISLAGKQARGTLYAVYDFLKSQGCAWYLPGALGEVLPLRKAIETGKQERVESPDYDVRGFLIYGQNFSPDGGWFYGNLDDYLDWAVRNRMNALFMGDRRTTSFGAHRGEAHYQTLNHAWARFLTDDHPEWWPLVKGKRVKNHFSGRPNQLSVGNKELRDFVTKTVIQHFKENPMDEYFSLCPEDEPAYWCEDPSSRALDGDQGKGEWKVNAAGTPSISMTDRTLNFANDIAERVSKVYPTKMIELYAYANFEAPPVREKVHPNVTVKYCLWPNLPLNRPLIDPSSEASQKVVKTIEGWKKAGVKNLALYDYGNWVEVESPNLRFFQSADVLKTFHEKWGFRQCLPETANNFWGSMMMYNLRAQLLWNTKGSYPEIVRKISREFYGPAGDLVNEYYLMMDEVLMKSEAWKQKGWEANLFMEYSMDSMKKGIQLLEKAREKVKGDKVLESRIGIMQYAHAFMTFSVAQKQVETLTAEDKEIATRQHQLANDLARQERIPIYTAGVAPLKNMYFPPSIKTTHFEFPEEWSFRKDPGNKGLIEKWNEGNWGAAGEKISTHKDWTAQGHAYHGVAWYSLNLTFPSEVAGKVKKSSDPFALYFAGLDGEMELYLNGEKIGEQKQDAGFMWDKPFSLLLPDNFDATRANRWVVRVKKGMAAAGIYKPVSLVQLRGTALKKSAFSGEEIHQDLNAAHDSEGHEAKVVAGWGTMGPQYIKSFKATADDSPSKGKYHLRVEGNNGGAIFYLFNTDAGKTYKVSYESKTVSGQAIACAFTEVEGNQVDLLNSLLESKACLSRGYSGGEFFFKATTDSTAFGFRLAGAEGESIELFVDNVSIQELKE